MTGTLHAFGDFELDERLYELRRGQMPVPIEPKVFDVLVYLLHHRDRVVPKHELLRELWPPSVSPSVLPRCIRAARQCLGDDARRQEILQTIRGRGYRFVAPLRRGPRDDVLAELRRAWSLARQRRGHMVALSGPAKAGKTACVGAFVQELAGEAIVVRGRGVNRDDRPDFWPWIQILREAVEWLDGIEPDPTLPPLSLPDLSASSLRAADLTPDQPQARFKLHDAIGRFLGSMGERKPVVVLLEDAQWIDDESQRLLQHLGTSIASISVLVVVTGREAASLEPLWAELSREPNFARVKLGIVPAPGMFE
jgi:DNA-binding winged helix-turn-helix (wHTH) protein